jgi:intein/homing endonuclease
MALYWQKYFDLFGSLFSRDLSKEAPDPANMSGAGIGRSDSAGSSEYLEGGSTFNHTVALHSLNDFLEVGEHTDRRARYLEYDRLENIPEIHSALETYCITKDSIINTPNGDFTIEELLNKYPSGENFLIYCYDKENEKSTVGNAHHVRRTKKDIVYEIKFDNKSIKCTGDHKFLTIDGTWKEAKDLKFNDKLKPYSEDTEYSNHEVVSVSELGEEDVYDLTTDIYHNFACNGVIIHNSDEITTPDINGRIFEVICKSQIVKEELEWLFFDLLNVQTEKLWSWARALVKNGDLFLEIIIDPDHPDYGIQRIMDLPAETMYRIETVRGRTLEFQQSYMGPNYQIVLNDLNNKPQSMATDNMAGYSQVTTTGTMSGYMDHMGARCIRFKDEQIVHVRIGLKRRGFYPYGVSILYAGRRVAHLLKLMEDAMVIYRLTRAPEKRIFYIDVGNVQPHKGEQILQRIKDKIKKKQIFNRRTGSIDERYNPWTQDEDFFIATRPEASTRIETLPGACLALNTRIPLLDGRTLELSEIIKEHENGKQNWVYSCNPETGEIVPGIISWAGVTRKNTEVLKITLDNGESVICTPDHKFPIIGKGKIQAKDLEIGESLIPFNTRRIPLLKKYKDEYTQVYDNKRKEWEFVHRLVANYFKNTELEQIFVFDEQNSDKVKSTVHHKNFDRLNNNPDNLCWMNSKDHWEYHSSLGCCRWRIDNEERLKSFKNKHSESLKKYINSLSPEDRKKRSKISAQNVRKGNSTTVRLLASDEKFRKSFIEKQIEGFKKSKELNPDKWKKRGLKQSELNKVRYSDPEYKENVFKKQRLQFDEWMMDKAVSVLRTENGRADFTLKSLNSDVEFIERFVSLNSHIKRDNFDRDKGFTLNHFNKMCKLFNYDGVRDLKRKLNLYSDAYKAKVKFEKHFMNYIISSIKFNNCDTDQTISDINNNSEFMNRFLYINKNINKSEFDKNDLTSIVQQYGYKDEKHLFEESELYNHKVVSIEYLNDKIDTGTITVDGNEIYHNLHTFALDCGCLTYNSNLNEIDDTKYFREKLMVALKLPKNYLFQEDVAVNRTSFATQDMRFARTIYRIQGLLAEGLMMIAKRHLVLCGFPEEDIRDIQIKFTQPSDWLELSRSEILNNRYNLASSIKGAQLYDDYTILTKILKHSDEDAKSIIDRLEQQILRQQEIQAQAQLYSQLSMPSGPEGSELGSSEMSPEEQGILPSSEEGPSGQQVTPALPELSGIAGVGVQTTAISKEKKPERYTDFEDLESDSEEKDLNY